MDSPFLLYEHRPPINSASALRKPAALRFASIVARDATTTRSCEGIISVVCPAGRPTWNRHLSRDWICLSAVESKRKLPRSADCQGGPCWRNVLTNLVSPSGRMLSPFQTRPEIEIAKRAPNRARSQPHSLSLEISERISFDHQW